MNQLHMPFDFVSRADRRSSLQCLGAYALGAVPVFVVLFAVVLGIPLIWSEFPAEIHEIMVAGAVLIVRVTATLLIFPIAIRRGLDVGIPALVSCGLVMAAFIPELTEDFVGTGNTWWFALPLVALAVWPGRPDVATATPDAG